MAILGIDLSKSKFDAALLMNGKTLHKVCQNTADGFAELVRWLEKRGVRTAHVCMEATGRYGEGLATFLHDQGFTLSIVNPARIKAFGNSELSRTKTDKADAALIARFCQAQQPEAWTPPPAELRELQAMVRHLEALLDMRQQEANRLEAGVAEQQVAASINAHLEFLDEQIEETRKRLKKHIDRHPDLRKSQDLLTSIPGIGDTTAAKLLAEIGDVSAFSSARELASYAGLAPRQHQSGSSVRGKSRLSKVGNARLRKALYMPAIVAKNRNPIIRSFCERLKARGKSTMAILGAAMRKLLHLAYGVLKTGKRFDPGYAAAAAA